MTNAASMERMTADNDRRIADVVERERSRLMGFIRRRVSDLADAEDILQDVLSELVEANRLLMPVEHVTGWLFRVARNRITDRFRRKAREPWDDGDLPLEEILPSLDAGPDARLVRRAALEDLARAVAELPPAQREVFVGHEIEGRTFRQMAAETGVSINTLLARKRYAVIHLRKRLRGARHEITKERKRP